MSRRNTPRLEVGRTYQLDGRKRRWRLDAVEVKGEDQVLVLSSGTTHHLFLSPPEALKRLREVWP